MFGTCITNAPTVFSGDSPIKNWDGVGLVDFPDPNAISGQAVIARQQKKYGCWHCTIACGGHMMGPAGEYEYAPGSHKPEYETWASFGSMCLNNNFESIMKVNDICNRHGLDTISAGVTVAFAIECFERGIIDEKDTGGIRLGWGNHQGIVALTELIAERKGFGAVLADGVKLAAARIGRGSEQYAIHVEGQEVPMHDPKMNPFQATTYQMDATPARHTQGAEGWLNPVGLPLPEYESTGYAGRGEAHKMAANAAHVVNCAGLCVFGAACSPVDALFEFMSAVTGYDRGFDELLIAGERIANMRHLFNLREGLNPVKYKVPRRMLGKPPQQAGPLAGKEVDSDTLVREFCQAMQWDPITARPNPARLKELGLA